MFLINQNNVAASMASDKTTKASTCTQFATAICPSYQVLLQTANVQVLNKEGHPVFCRALLESGSQINLMTNACRAKLRLALETSDSTFTGPTNCSLWEMHDTTANQRHSYRYHDINVSGKGSAIIATSFSEI